MRVRRSVSGGMVAAALAVAVTATMMVAGPASAHHSFASYNMDQVKVFTGIVTRVNPDANHLQIFFAVMNDERKNVIRDADNKPVVWAVEMGGSAQSAQEGISVNSFPPGTIFSVAMHPLRTGGPAGSRVNPGAVFKCPEKKPPAAGKHCDSVEGNLAIGKGDLAAPKE
ncbi:MAG: DUF6152 family protein [Gammaproteobacteria bacterium]